MSRLRRTAVRDEVPPYIWKMEPDRYRDAAASYLENHPDDTFWAAMAVWRAYLTERREWLRSHGVPRRVNGRDMFGTPRPPVAWVRSTFGTSEARWPS
ncbi:hypothetical protein [Streptomyces sp. NBC_00483]|uniref:hypothetical protein n=1 Tax=Streptomyces sp. NBC_00483 TaxID=2975756 RepID=UPI002E190715